MALAVSLVATPVLAQNTATTPGAAPTLVADAAAPNEEIVVTGTRIPRLDFKTANPIISVDAAAIQTTGETNLTTYLTRLPALVGSFGQDQAAGGNSAIGIGETGLNELNLRNLGTDRTLVLIDGRRQVGGEAGSAAVDINTIPTDLIERVDVLTGGASAIYGADGVTGVVNFILKKNFHGLTIRAQDGISSRGDGGQRLVAATYGVNFADNRGNLAVAYEYGSNDRLATLDRPYLAGTRAVTFHNTPNSSGPSRIPLNDIRFFDSSRQGGIDVDGDFLPDYVGTGAPFDHGSFVPDFYQQGGSGTLQSDYRGDLLPRIDRHIVNALAHFDVSDKLTFYAEAKYAHTSSYSISQPTFDYYIHVNSDNPYIPADLRPIIAATNDAFDAGLADEPALLDRDNFDLGTRGERIKRNTLRGVVGARGDLSDDLHYDVSYVYSRNKITNHFIGDQYTDRFFAAVDAVPDGNGGVTCRINVDPAASIDEPDDYTRTLRGGPLSFAPGTCVPLNLFGENSPSQQAINFISINTTNHQKLTQQVLSGSIGGDFRKLFSLPGGPIGFALGGEYRRETSRDVPDPAAQAGLTFSNLTPIAQGKFNVKEAFAELDAPVLKDVRFAHLLDVGAAIRFSDYSTVGKTTTWRFTGQYAPVRDITFRATLAQAVRAPNIGELFAPNGQDFQFIADPCAPANIDLGKASRPANCQALLTGLGADPADFADLNSSNISGVSGGNPTLKAEKARTWTVGAVLQPHFLRGFTVSADWYDIRLRQAINQVTPQELADLCVDQASLDNPFCAQIVRNNGGSQAGRIVSFSRVPQNVASFATSGLDIDLNYVFEPRGDIGTFNAHLVGNYLDKLTEIGTPGADLTNFRGASNGASSNSTDVRPAPKFSANFDARWNYHGFALAYNLSWFSHTLRYSHDQVNGDPNLTALEYKYYKARFQHDIYASIDVTDRFELYGGINNFLDTKPGLGSEIYPIEPLGRFFFAGVKLKIARVL